MSPPAPRARQCRATYERDDCISSRFTRAQTAHDEQHAIKLSEPPDSDRRAAVSGWEEAGSAKYFAF
jgi:hypothetical protein